MSRLRVCWMVQGPSGFVVVPSRCMYRLGDLQHEEHGDPCEGDSAVDVEEVACQHGRGLRVQELAPDRVRVRQWRRWDASSCEDAADRASSYSLTECE